ncbi:MAG: hypothetical protein EAX96_09640 [Candidatus Lokiarchaeota archaeon]|nr:hypothetical protein [Candidatus Lokiarchaeota archaeon]
MVTKITTKLLDSFSRSIETVFFMLLYNQLVLKTSELFEGEDVTKLLKEFGSDSAIRSCKRHPTVLKFAPKANDLEKIVELVEFLWVVAFGRTPEFNYDIIEDSSDKRIIKLNIFECPLCLGIDQNDLNIKDLEKIHNGEENYSCILTGMIEGATKFLMEIQNIENYEIKIKETACFLENEKMEITVNFFKIS